jgi:hypothetical protein
MANRKDVYTIRKNGKGEGSEKAFWVRIGSAYVNKDGSLNVYLNALPLTGELNIRDPKPREAAAQ